MSNAEFTPTAEQEAALAAYATGADLIIEAGAGSGKTSTLKLLARSNPATRAQYIAFNKAIVTEAQASMPDNVNAATAHSLAFRAVGHQFAHRLRGRRMHSAELATRLRIEPRTFQVADQQKTLGAPFLAGLVMRAITTFCQSADLDPTRRHVPYIEGLDLPKPDGSRAYTNNNRLAEYIEGFLASTWADLTRPDGSLPYRHEHYLKLWQLSSPLIQADAIFFDEAQDVSPVLAAIVAAQSDHAQRIYVGDQNQAIYGFTGAVDAIAHLKAGGTTATTLSQSFRFGQAIADVANLILAELPTGMRLVGTPSIQSIVGLVPKPDAILCRTNAVAVQMLISEAARGRRPHLVGGGAEVASFARGALDLQTNGRTDHQDLACFSSWGEAQEYVQQDAQGDEIKLLVNLVDRFGPDAILAALERMPREDAADLVISTAHKSKGRQWRSVRLADDFPDDREKATDDELRLLYVAVTRAQLQLDASSIGWLVGDDEEAEEVPAPRTLADLWQSRLTAERVPA